MIKREAGRFVIEGPNTFATVRALLEAGRREMAACDGEVRVDLSRVTEADSTAVSLLLHWLRDARRRGTAFAVLNPPQSVTGLARVYGVAEMLGLPDA